MSSLEQLVAASTRFGFKLFAKIVDRPFFCAIRDDETGAILFLGSIVDPQ